MVTTFQYEYMDKTIDKGLQCYICHAPFVDPISTPCRHAFCRRCITNKLAEKSQCPECDRPLSTSNFIPMVLFVCKMLDDLLVKCIACAQTEIKRSQFNHHIEEICPKTLVPCSAADIRCPWKGRPNQLSLHTVSCDYERLRVVLTELITENKQLKIESCSRQTTNIALTRESTDAPAQRTEGTATIAQLTEEANFARDVICYQNKALEESINRFAKSSSMDLRNQGLTDLDMGIIIQKSIIDLQCTDLQLQGNKITDLGISLLVHGLRNNTSVTKLNLSHNPISDIGISSLASLLAMNNTKIDKLYIGGTLLTDQGVHYLAMMLKSNTTVKSLGIYKSQLSDHGVGELAYALAKSNKSLQHLYIDDNSLVTNASIDALIDIINSNQSVVIIGMRHCGLNVAGIRRLQQVASQKANFKLVA